MSADRRCPDDDKSDDTPGIETDANSSMGATGVWFLLGTITLGVALLSFYLATISTTSVFFSGWLATFGYREFAIVNAFAAFLSYATASRLHLG